MTSVRDARSIAAAWLDEHALQSSVRFGFPEIDDRRHTWRVPLKNASRHRTLGELVIDAFLGAVDADKSTRPELLRTRLTDTGRKFSEDREKPVYSLSPLENTVLEGDCAELLPTLPEGSVDLVFTSPPYFNARPECSQFEAYESYLASIRDIVRKSHRVLADGRFFVVNSAPVLLRRTSRYESSCRLAVPFDLHRIFTEEGFDFIEDIVWVKPAAAGWATNRGRRFAADRRPLQYKTVPVTEYILVYRKKSNLLIDWFFKNHPDRKALEDSRIPDGYEATNVWHIPPNNMSKHPAAFPLELAGNVVRYYSFKNDVVLDPFAGSGTVGAAAAALGRRYVLMEINPEYAEMTRRNIFHHEGTKTREGGTKGL